MSSDPSVGVVASSTSTSLGLTPAQLAQFDHDGYLILPDFFTAHEADRLKARADELLEGLDLATHPRTIFKTNIDGPQTAGAGSSMAHDPNRYFLDSADKISFFFEADAFDAQGQLTVPKTRAINKIGHALHTLDPEFHAFTYKPEVKALAKSLGFIEPVCLQSMAILKQPRIGGVVDPHRDSTFLYTVPSTATGLWFAFEDCTSTNGCLSFVPGSHKDGANRKRFGRKATDIAPLRASINNPDYDASAADSTPNNANVELVFTGEDARKYGPEEYVPAEVKKGSLVLIHGEVVHASTHNHSDKSRYIYTFHLIDRHGTTYPKENWLQSAHKFPALV